MGTLKDMEKALAADGELAAKFAEALKGAGAAGAKSDVEAIVLAAGAAGFELAPEDVEKELAEAQQLSQSDLEEVAAGINGNDDNDEFGKELFCGVTWHCYTVYRHTYSESQEQSCWSDYQCIFVYHGIECFD